MWKTLNGSTGTPWDYKLWENVPKLIEWKLLRDIQILVQSCKVQLSFDCCFFCEVWAVELQTECSQAFLQTLISIGFSVADICQRCVTYFYQKSWDSISDQAACFGVFILYILKVFEQKINRSPSTMRSSAVPWCWACTGFSGSPERRTDCRCCSWSTWPEERWRTHQSFYSAPVGQMRTCSDRQDSPDLKSPLRTQHRGSPDLKYVSLEDVVAQFHRLLPVQLPLLPGEHEGQQGMAAPVDNSHNTTHNVLSEKIKLDFLWKFNLNLLKKQNTEAKR